MNFKSHTRKVQTNLFGYVQGKDDQHCQPNINSLRKSSKDYTEEYQEIMMEKNQIQENEEKPCQSPRVQPGDRDIEEFFVQSPKKKKEQPKDEEKPKEKSAQKHYKKNFNVKWMDTTHKEYRDWIRATSDPKTFFDVACNAEFDCEYLYRHESKNVHKENYRNWKDSQNNNQKLDKDLNLSKRILVLQSKVVYS